jgi:hypothetical protein
VWYTQLNHTVFSVSLDFLVPFASGIKQRNDTTTDNHRTSQDLLVSKLKMQVVIFSLPSQLKVKIPFKKVKILNHLQPGHRETGVSKLETPVSFYNLTPQK